MAKIPVNKSMLQYDFEDKNGNYDLLYQYVKDNPIRKIIDVGAWWGPWSMWWHDKATSVEIFEPNKDILPKLINNVGKFQNCTIHRNALGDRHGSVSMQCADHSGTYHVTDQNGDIEIKTLDSFDFNNVDIIKIDTEGYELPVLEGAKQTILGNRPWIQIEGNKSGERYGRTKLDINIFLTDLGMTRVTKKWPDQVWTFKKTA
jgi:FkbM family methyltransferase|tara:strand:- start:15 stop:623 length:609 start_codon:yes stop_codon:yes gene_type:complete